MTFDPFASPCNLTRWRRSGDGTRYREKLDVDGFAIARVSLLEVSASRFTVVGRRRSSGWGRETILRRHPRNIAERAGTEWLQIRGVR